MRVADNERLQKEEARRRRRIRRIWRREGRRRKKKEGRGKVERSNTRDGRYAVVPTGKVSC
jgi:hypothetical protein